MYETLIYYIESTPIDEFADKHNLVMLVRERPPHINAARFYAMFEDVVVKEGGCLAGVYGDGATELEAINDYAKQISSRCLIVGANKLGRREIFAPRLDPMKMENFK